MTENKVFLEINDFVGYWRDQIKGIWDIIVVNDDIANFMSTEDSERIKVMSN